MPQAGRGRRSGSDGVGTTIELNAGPVAAGGGCVARTAEGQVVFVRHTLPGERVLARVTGESSSFLRADAVEVVEASSGRVAPPCPHAGPGRCGGCDWQHISLPVQRRLREDLVAEQLRRVARVDQRVQVEEVEGAPDGLAWRTRVRFAVDGSGRTGFHRHRSRHLEPVETCPIATARINELGLGSIRWRGARHVEVTASPDGGPPIISVDTGRGTMDDEPGVDAGLVVNGSARRDPSVAVFEVLGHRFEVSAGVFWQVHPGGAGLLAHAVLDGLSPAAGERVVDLYAGAGLFTVACAMAVGPLGSVTAVERSAPACADAVRNSAGLTQVKILQSEVSASLVAEGLGPPDLVVLDPARQGAGPAVVRALAALRPPPRALAYVSCDPASFARDLRILLEAGWSMTSLRAFDLFPMTAHVELVGILVPPPDEGTDQMVAAPLAE